MSIKLYDLVGKDLSRPFSPHCWKVRMALEHKGLPYQCIPTVFTEVATLEGGTTAMVPTIRDGDKVVADSFAIALYLEQTYPECPSLFGGPGGEAMARFIERWTLITMHPFLASSALMDIHDRLAPPDQQHFRKTREERFKKTLEEVPVGREERREGFLRSLQPLRDMLNYQPYLGGAQPLFCDYIVFGALQWVRVISPFRILPPNDALHAWFDRCLQLHNGVGASVPAAA